MANVLSVIQGIERDERKKRYIDAAVPFIHVGNRQAITDRMIIQQPWLLDFISTFRESFQRHDDHQCFYFEPPPAKPLSDRHAVGE